MIKKTITTIFMVPTLKIPKDPLLSSGFINAYIKDDRRDVQYEGCIYLLFHPNDIDKFREFLDSEYERTKDVIEDYDYEDGFIVVVYKLEPRFKRDFELVRKGQYSKTSHDFQEQFPKSVKLVNAAGWSKEETSLQIRVFKRSEDLLDYWQNKLGVVFDPQQEVWEGFDIEKETLKLDEIKPKFKTTINESS